MLEGGEDPLYVARRLVVVASEDVGLADLQGLPLVWNLNPIPFLTFLTCRKQAMACYQACQVIGLPECRINLAVRIMLIHVSFVANLKPFTALCGLSQ